MKNSEILQALPQKPTRVGVFGSVQELGPHEVVPVQFSVDHHSTVRWAVCLRETSDEELDHLARIAIEGLFTHERNVGRLRDRGWRHSERLCGDVWKVLNFGDPGGLDAEDQKQYRKLKTLHSFQFTEHWFRHSRMATYSVMLRPRFVGKPMRMLQIGVFEGQDLVWMFQHVLTHPESSVVAIDPWSKLSGLDAQRRHAGRGMRHARQRAMRNLDPWRDRIQFIEDRSQDVMPDMRMMFDLIVIDGDHSQEVVEADAENALPLLRKGGWMLFDDVEQKIKFAMREIYQTTSRQGVIQFLKEHGDRVRFRWRHRYSECYEKL